ncbi:VraH family peptide resistance protein [Staphylococcus xylosus]|uniref:VraH family peptide resistance protein n=1 Tax=Staphylococcus xylosus TaxID=1288 RepID=UPI001642C1DF|nr:VraH family protein [Staphylococcus xylosus]MEB7507201.1 VraH family protein [Staphylococcus xylosus]MEB8059666.1 VraH family protein [Staphylococcus xylosus]
MTIKQMWKELLNKNWDSDDLFGIVVSILIASFLTTPLFGIPIGIVVYFLLFYKEEDFDEMAEKYDFKEKIKEVKQK